MSHTTAPELPRADQSVLDLFLGVFAGDVDESQFTILNRKKINIAEVEVDAGIIGESDFIKLKIRNFTLSEVLACIPFHCESPSVYFGRLADAPEVVVYKRDSGMYSHFRHKIVTIAEGRHELDSLKRRAKDYAKRIDGIGMMSKFPPCKNIRFIRVTVVAIRLDINSGILKVETAHSFPNENSIAFTNTVTDFKSLMITQYTPVQQPRPSYVLA